MPDLILKISDLKLIVSKLEELEVQEFRIKHTQGTPSMNCLSFDFNSGESISFMSLFEYDRPEVSIYYDGGGDQFEEYLCEPRALMIYLNEFGE